MTNKQVCDAFIEGRKAESLNMSTDGVKIWSYGTVLAQWSGPKKLIYNSTKYSPTTSKQQTYLKRAIHKAPFVIDLRVTEPVVPLNAQDLTKYVTEK